jgi:hypothetical protein
MKCCPLNSCKLRQVWKKKIPMILTIQSKQVNHPTLCIVRIVRILEMSEFQNAIWMWTHCTRVAIDLTLGKDKSIKLFELVMSFELANIIWFSSQVFLAVTCNKVWTKKSVSTFWWSPKLSVRSYFHPGRAYIEDGPLIQGLVHNRLIRKLRQLGGENSQFRHNSASNT